MAKAHPLGLTDGDYKQLVQHVDTMKKFKENLDMAKQAGIDVSDLEQHHAYLTDRLNVMKQILFQPSSIV